MVPRTAAASGPKPNTTPASGVRALLPSSAPHHVSRLSRQSAVSMRLLRGNDTTKYLPNYVCILLTHSARDHALALLLHVASRITPYCCAQRDKQNARHRQYAHAATILRINRVAPPPPPSSPAPSQISPPPPPYAPCSGSSNISQSRARVRVCLAYVCASAVWHIDRCVVAAHYTNAAANQKPKHTYKV